MANRRSSFHIFAAQVCIALIVFGVFQLNSTISEMRTRRNLADQVQSVRFEYSDCQPTVEWWNSLKVARVSVKVNDTDTNLTSAMPMPIPSGYYIFVEGYTCRVRFKFSERNMQSFTYATGDRITVTYSTR